MKPMLRSVRPLVAVLLWLTTGFVHTESALSKRLDNQVILKGIGLLPLGVTSEEETSIDTDGAPHVEKVFIHRFSHVLGNQTERRKFESALDFILDAEEQLSSTFNAAPRTAQLLRDHVSGSASALHAIQLARELSDHVASSDGAGFHAKAVTETLQQIATQLKNLSHASCHPITRRIILASLVRLQLLLHESPLSEEAKTFKDSPDTPRLFFHICRLLFNLHRQGGAAKGAIEFLHISKSGGTSMCSVADRNGCVAESVTNYGNCMVRRFDDRPRWVSAEVHNQSAPLDGWRWFYRYSVRRGNRSCEYRDEYMQRMRFTFYSNEFAVHGGLEGDSSDEDDEHNGDHGGASGASWHSTHVCPQFLNVVMLRQPLARLLSHIKWIIKVYRSEYGRRSEAFFRARDADYWRAFAPAAVDNYYIRLLLGEAVFYMPSGTVNTTHLAAAKLVLLQYDVVMLLEADDIDELWLRMALGWRVGLSSAHARVASSSRTTNELVPFDVDDLMAANTEDVHLYDFGAVLHQLDGFMFAVMSAAGIQPYSPYNYLEASDPGVGKRVRCGYVTRKQQLLANMDVNVSELHRVYDSEFPRILSIDERVRAPPPTPPA
ncbi:hypothetical protein Vretimale_12920 [Volvox reticuliferus]|uniref:Uncharacterized protein n=1 Tax=Volvox reticuliferus TaxID=1737510 RepID=A0A8J4LT20_9CHLO|nr:hypothetical protein Vretifemale_9284 [Volvox reticuliferus]GIM09020.1 hypothetical protein Vretimale_12920 [Volvox reticuliferus]